MVEEIDTLERPSSFVVVLITKRTFCQSQKGLSSKLIQMFDDMKGRMKSNCDFGISRVVSSKTFLTHEFALIARLCLVQSY